MARRKSGPWQRKRDGAWYTTVGRKMVRLGESDDSWEKIEAAYHKVHGRGEKPTNLTVDWLIGAFLEDCERSRAKSTYKWYEFYLSDFRKFVGPRLQAERLTPAALNKWLSKYDSETTQHGAARTVVRALNWAVNERLIDRSPLQGFVKPTPGRREFALSPEQFKLCLEKAETLKDVLNFLWTTGCRPQELRAIEASWIVDRQILFPQMQSKGKKKRTVIYLTETAAEIAHRLAYENPEGKIFRNQRGKKWTKNGLNLAFNRLRKRTGIKGLCPYSLRHGFATEMLKKGMDTTTLAALMNNSPAMIHKHYSHVAEDSRHLLSSLEMLSGVGMPQAAPA